jgi:hypothetical protein
LKPPSKEPIEIDWKVPNQNITLGIGDCVMCRFHRHGSVGEDAEFEIGSTDIIVHDDTHTEYVHPEHMKKPEWTGGDAERGQWIFRAIGIGKTTLTIRVLFRFDVESEHQVSIVVK